MKKQYHQLVQQFTRADGTIQTFCAMCGAQVVVDSWPTKTEIPCVMAAQLEAMRRPMPPQRVPLLARWRLGRLWLKYRAARVRWIAAGRPMTPPETLAERVAACESCPHRVRGLVADSCGKCGCFLRAKQKMATEQCPDRRWGEPPHQDCNCDEKTE